MATDQPSNTPDQHMDFDINTDYLQPQKVKKDKDSMATDQPPNTPDKHMDFSINLQPQKVREDKNSMATDSVEDDNVLNLLQDSPKVCSTSPPSEENNQQAYVFCLDESIYDCKKHTGIPQGKAFKLKVYSMSKSSDTDGVMLMDEQFSGAVPLDDLSIESKTIDCQLGETSKTSPQQTCSSSQLSSGINDGKHISKGKHRCKHCGKFFSRKLSVSRHIKNIHSPNPTIYKCELCGKVYKDHANFQQHVNGIHNGVFKYTCKDCGRGYNRLMQYNVHLSTHSGKMLYKCDICSQEFLWKHYLTVHMRQHKGEFPFQCNQCEKKFHSSSRLINHKRTHVKYKELIKTKQCKFCSKKFETKRDVANHERVHTGEKTFCCTTCNRSYASKSALREHEKTHGERDIVCPVCEKTFYKTFVLKEHMKIHTQEMPFMCQFCAKRYRYGSNFRAHERMCAKSHSV